MEHSQGSMKAWGTGKAASKLLDSLETGDGRTSTIKQQRVEGLFRITKDR